MSLDSAIQAGRRAAEHLMVDRIIISRVSRVGVEDGLGGETFPLIPVYEGVGKIQTYEPYEQTPNVGGASIVMQRYSVHVPWDAGVFEPGDVVKVLEARWDVSSIGREYRVAGLHEKTLQTAQRLLVDELVKGPTNG